VTEPIFWLALSLFLVALCLAAVLMAAIPAFLELARASRSAEKLFDTLYRELPPTLEAIRLTGLEISDLTDDLSEGVESAGHVAKQFDQGIRSAQRQVQGVGTATQSIFVGMRAAWKSLTRSSSKRRRTAGTSGRSRDRHSARDLSSPPEIATHYDKPQQPAKSSLKSEYPGSDPSAAPAKVETFPDRQ
jgi:hypothetical protein